MIGKILSIVVSKLKVFSDRKVIVVALVQDKNKIVVQGSNGKHYRFEGDTDHYQLNDKIIIPRKELIEIYWRRKIGFD